MCLGKAYIEAGGKSELVMDSISLMEIDGATVRLSTIFGDRKELEARVRQIDFEGSRIFLASAAPGDE